VYPALHAHEEILELPIGDWLLLPQVVHESDVDPVAELQDPAGHRVHAAEPDAALYVPAKHSPQGPPSLPVKPTLHRQRSEEPDPADEYEPDGQETHVEDNVAPTSNE
jgi:hypothetical protein